MYKYTDYIYPKKLNWPQIFNDLAEHNVSPYQVSVLIGVKWSTLQRWLVDVEPRYSVGVSILELHSRYCGEELTGKRLEEV